MATPRVKPQETETPLGRHTRLAIPFKWRKAAGDFIDLTGYIVRVWVSKLDGTLTADSPRQATVNGTEAVFQMGPNDLAQAGGSLNELVTFTAVAEKDDTVLPPNKRAVRPADWIGAEEWSPAQ